MVLVGRMEGAIEDGPRDDALGLGRFLFGGNTF